jgi:hypothetical protein
VKQINGQYQVHCHKPDKISATVSCSTKITIIDPENLFKPRVSIALYILKKGIYNRTDHNLS